MSNVKHPPIGIDLGTSTSLLCVYENGNAKAVAYANEIAPLMPSVVGWDQSKVFFGDQAERLRGKSKTSFLSEVKRKMGENIELPLGNQVFVPQAISAMILKELVRNAEERLGFKIEEVVISVPANFKNAQRQATKEAAEIAGLHVSQLIPEPTAAALAFGVKNIDSDQSVLVFDFGGGTLDIALLEMCEGVIDVQRVDGDDQLGGKNIDDILVAHVKKHIERQGFSYQESQYNDLKKICELAKKELSDKENIDINLASISHQIRSLPLSRNEFNALIKPCLDRASECLLRLINGDGIKFKKIDTKSIDKILMVGGSTYIPAVRQLVEKIIGKKVSSNSGVSPDQAVAKGACLRSAMKRDDFDASQSIILSDISPFAIGVSVVSMAYGMLIPDVFSKLIEKGAPIPSSASKKYSLLSNKQSECEIKLYQGEGQLINEEQDHELLATANISEIPASTTDEPRNILLQFQYDLSGIVTVNAEVEGTNCKVQMKADPRNGKLSVADKNKAMSLLNQMNWGKSEQPTGSQASSIDADDYKKSKFYADVKLVMNQAEKRLETGKSMPKTRQIHHALKQALIKDQQSLIEKLEEELTDALLEESNH